MEIIVIGGCGHIGSYLVPKLVKAGHEVAVISRGKSQPYVQDSAWERVKHVHLDRSADEDFADQIAAMDADKTEEVLFGLGEKLVDEHFNKAVYVKPIFGFDKPMLVDNVTFEPGCRNNWHVHQKGQTLFVVSGRGWYQEEGKTARELHPSAIVEIPAGVKHWHGAARDSWFTHLAVEDYTKGAPDWYGSVDDEFYDSLS
jgi:quercetin dioxygenase-like cupin family protein